MQLRVEVTPKGRPPASQSQFHLCTPSLPFSLMSVNHMDFLNILLNASPTKWFHYICSQLTVAKNGHICLLALIWKKDFYNQSAENLAHGNIQPHIFSLPALGHLHPNTYGSMMLYFVSRRNLTTTQFWAHSRFYILRDAENSASNKIQKQKRLQNYVYVSWIDTH